MSVVVAVGTIKGGFLLRSDEARKEWTLDGPIFKGWKVTAAARKNGRTYLATASDVYGAAIQVSDDLQKWRQIENGPKYPEGGERKMNQIWRLSSETDTLYAGVDEAGLFQSTDDGESWSPVDGLNNHSTRSAWYPGAGGLCAHSILHDPKDSKRLWCGISAVGVFRSDDGGASWTPKNEGVPVVIEDKDHKDIGYCVHALVADPDDADKIYRQDHAGMYRSKDGGDTWQCIEEGLASKFGFPIVMDRRTRTLYAVPLESDEYRIPPEGKLRVYRSSNAGDSWESASSGLPQEHAYMCVLRRAVGADQLDPCGLYVGTTAGSLHVSADRGQSWTNLPWTLPRILSVDAFIEE